MPYVFDYKIREFMLQFILALRIDGFLFQNDTLFASVYLKFHNKNPIQICMPDEVCLKFLQKAW